MRTYGLYDGQDVLRVCLTIHNDGRPEWDFSQDEWGGQWLSEEDRADIVRAIEGYERAYLHEPGFMIYLSEASDKYTYPMDCVMRRSQTALSVHEVAVRSSFA